MSWQLEVALERRFERPGDAKLALDRRFGRPGGVKLALERRFGCPGNAKLALDRRFGGQLAPSWPWNSEGTVRPGSEALTGFLWIDVCTEIT